MLTSITLEISKYHASLTFHYFFLPEKSKYLAILQNTAPLFVRTKIPLCTFISNNCVVSTEINAAKDEISTRIQTYIARMSPKAQRITTHARIKYLATLFRP